jgi:hypothetical protein
VKVVAWWFYDLRELNQPLHLPSNHPDQLAQNRKRDYELTMIAKALAKAAVHYRCEFAAGEALSIRAKKHGKGRRFNRLVNNQWCRKTLDEPVQRRLARANIPYFEVNPAFSSLSGNLVYGWGMGIPDPACAAVELGRRAIEFQVFNNMSTGGTDSGQVGGMRWKQCPSLAWPELKAAHGRQKAEKPSDIGRFTLARYLTRTRSAKGVSSLSLACLSTPLSRGKIGKPTEQVYSLR